MAEVETATVRVAEGQLRGRRVESRAGGTFWSFQGVPYARPPVGPLRFRDAQPAEPWVGVRDAFQEGNVCSQFNLWKNVYEGSEDCLFLNVFTPKQPAPREDRLPVMVFIHGGGFVLGSGNSDLYGPDYLMTEDVLLVTINYRVGVLGFLFLEEASPGNVGLKDQVAALRWVQRNIAAFGGDPGNVTLFGVSAGGASVHFHMLSPLSKGLFHRTIAMSGSALNPWAVQTEPAETTRRLARLLGCTSDDDAAVVDFLRGVDHKELVRVARTDAVSERDRGRLLKFSFVPTPERKVSGVETFLPAPVDQLMKEGRHHDVPFMTGAAEKEGIVVLLFSDFRKEDVACEIDGKWKDNILTELCLPHDGPKNAAALDEVRQFFMGGKPLSQDTMNGYIDLLSDISFNKGVGNTLRSIARKSTAPLYHYTFTVDDKLNTMKTTFKFDIPGAAHADDIGYLFHVGMNPIDIPEDSSATVSRRRWLRLWTNYAKTGDPTPSDDPLLGVRWKPYKENEKNYLEIGKELCPGKDLWGKRVAFWEKFYATYGS